MSQHVVRRSRYLSALICAGGVLAAEFAVANVRSATAGVPAPQPRATTISGATPGPVLTVINTNNKNASAILGVVQGRLRGFRV